MADAEIIPLGTRGRPGRGTGRDKPSSSSRSLAPGGQRSAPAPSDRAPDEVVDAAAPVDQVVVSADPTVPEQGRADDPADVAEQVADESAPAVDAPDAEVTRLPVPEPEAAADEEAPEPSSTVVGGSEPATAGERRRGLPLTELLTAARSAAHLVFGDDAERKLAELLAFARRRVTGDYEIDEYGLDPEITERFLMEMVRPLATKWFRVEVRGAENIPTDGGALVVANHSGTIPLDGVITMFSVKETTGRNLRPLGADLVFRLPFVGELARKGGATLACNEDAVRMLSHGELAAVWPEGFKGIGKPYSERYKLQRFGRGGFVSAAIRTGVPIVPCSIVGAEEIYPLVGNVPALARLLGLPYIPITPFFPLLGPLGLVPLPSKWIIEFGEPIRTDSFDPGAAEDPMLVFNVTDQVRETIQQTLYTLLMRRKSVFH
ncbi:lysophospholipid acyltransferase family protein [Nocardioides caldifontis]|uniref:lysophospholipid acyltransferase family protein n=1 Tax=Nocardioides caldifontis TaxID=2588938 RepID=UPI0011E03B16|nr:lysophospholipid acyltransferase family protein [Nocardioides caldifontis]